MKQIRQSEQMSALLDTHGVYSALVRGTCLNIVGCCSIFKVYALSVLAKTQFDSNNNFAGRRDFGPSCRGRPNIVTTLPDSLYNLDLLTPPIRPVVHRVRDQHHIWRQLGEETLDARCCLHPLFLIGDLNVVDAENDVVSDSDCGDPHPTVGQHLFSADGRWWQSQCAELLMFRFLSRAHPAFLMVADRGDLRRCHTGVTAELRKTWNRVMAACLHGLSGVAPAAFP
eukprot:6492779-Amphidinium_carterae.8